MVFDSIPLSHLQKQDSNFVVAMTGSTFDWLLQNCASLMPYILVRGAIFARMKPDNKAALD